MSLDIYQHLSYHAKNQRKEKKLTLKTHQMSNKWQYLTYQCVIFKPKLAK